MVVLYTIENCSCCNANLCNNCPCLILEVSGFANELLGCSEGTRNCNLWNSTSRFIQDGTNCTGWTCNDCPEDSCINTGFVVWNGINARWEMSFGEASCLSGGQSWYLAGVEGECPVGVWTYNTGGSCDMSSVVVETYVDIADCGCI